MYFLVKSKPGQVDISRRYSNTSPNEVNVYSLVSGSLDWDVFVGMVPEHSLTWKGEVSL